MMPRPLRLVCAIIVATIAVPCVGAAIQISIISARNGHGFSLLTALVETAVMVPLALLAAPVNGIGAILLGVLSLTVERTIGRRSVLIWLIIGLAIGWLSLYFLQPYGRNTLITIGVLGSWLVAGLMLWAFLSARWAIDDDSSVI